jgi:hypothetical protein
MPEPSLFRHYQIVQNADGGNVELVRDSRQVAVLAFDMRRMEFVHCHVLLEPLADGAAYDEACRRLRQSGHPLLARLLDFGIDEGNPYYITSHIDGETLQAYLARQNALPAWMAAAISYEALKAAAALLGRGGVLPAAVLDSLRIVQTGATDLQVRVGDFQLTRESTGTRPLVSTYDKAARQLRGFLQDLVRHPTGTAPAAELAPLLAACLGAASPAALDALRVLHREIGRLELPGGEITSAQRPRPLLAAQLPALQAVAQALAPAVKTVSQRLDPANPYALQGELLDGGRAVHMEALPPTRLAGRRPIELCRRVHALRDAGLPLLSVLQIEETGELACLAEALPEGPSLADLQRARPSLDPSEIHLLLKRVDAALTALEPAGLDMARLRLDDLFLCPCAAPAGPGTAALLDARLDDWPEWTIRLRAHPTLAALAGRGLDPAFLLPPASAGRWGAPWLAALGRLLLGSGGRSGRSAPEREALLRLLDTEILDGAPESSRSALLARVGALFPTRTVPAPVAVPEAPVVRPRTVPLVPVGSKPVPPAGGALTSGLPAEPVERPTVGFAEVLFRDTSVLEAGGGDGWTKTAVDAPPTIHPDEVLLPESEYVPLWLRAAVFIGGSMILGAVLAHYLGAAPWQHASPAQPDPVPALGKSVPDAPAAPVPEVPELPPEKGPEPGSPLLTRPPGLKEEITRSRP